MKVIFNTIVEADAAILNDIQNMKDDQESELTKFNKMLDAFYLDQAVNQY